MSGDEERLFVLLEARIGEFEKRMIQAERRGTATYGKLRDGSRSATRAMEADMVRSTGRINQALGATAGRIGSFAKVFAGGFVGGVLGGVAAAGVTGVVNRVNDLARGIAEVGDEAKRAGVSAQVFQEWKFIAEQNRIGVDSMVDGLKELNLRADEFIVTGKGPAAEAFARLGYGAEELRRKLADPSELMLEIIGRLGELDRAAQIRVADEIFGGTGGERFVELISQGEDGLRRTIDRAHDLGVVMDDALIAKADEVNRRFNEISNTVGVALKSAIVSAADSLADFIESFRAFENQRSSSLEGRLNDVMRERAGLVERRGQVEGAEGIGGRATATLNAQIEALTAEEDEIIGILRSRTQIAAPTRPTDRTWTPPAAEVPSGDLGGSGSGGGAERVNDLEREIEAIIKRTRALEAATAAQATINPLLDDFGQSAARAGAAQELLVAAQQAGVTVTPDLAGTIGELADAYAQAEMQAGQLDAQQDEILSKQEQWQQFRKDTARGFVDDLLEGATAADALAGALGRVADRMLDLALDGLFASGRGGAGGGAGGGGGVVGGLLAGVGNLLGFSDGTANTGGLRDQVRGVVHGQEAVIPLPNGGRVPVDLRSSGAAGAPLKPGKVEVLVRLSGDLDATISQVAGDVAARVVQGAAPDIIRRSVQSTDAAMRATRRGFGR